MTKTTIPKLSDSRYAMPNIYYEHCLSWYRKDSIDLKLNYGFSVRVPLLNKEETELVQERFPRLFKMLVLLYREHSDVSKEHIAALLYYSALCQAKDKEFFYNRLSPNEVFTWNLTGNPEVWSALNHVYNNHHYDWGRLIPAVREDRYSTEDDHDLSDF